MKILVPVDCSRQSQSAIDALLGMQWPAGSEIKLLAVVPAGDPGIPLAVPGGVRVDAEQMTRTREGCEDFVKGLARELQLSLRKCDVVYGVASGDPANEILRSANDGHFDLIVMGSRGNRGLDLLLLGSVSQHVLNQSPCPVMVVKTEASEKHNIQQGFNNIVLSVDNSPYTAAAVRWLTQLSWKKDARLHLITVIEAMPDSFSFETNTAKASRLLHKHEALERGATRELAKLAAELSNDFDPERISVHVAEGDPKHAILDLAEQTSADLIVMGSHGRGGLKKLILGSVSQSVCVHASCAVAVVRGIVRKGSSDMQKTGMFKMPEQSLPVVHPASAASAQRRNENESPTWTSGGF